MRLDWWILPHTYEAKHHMSMIEDCNPPASPHVCCAVQSGMEEYFSSHVCDSVCVELGLHESSPVNEALASLRMRMGRTLRALIEDTIAPEEMSISDLLAELSLRKVKVHSGEERAFLVAELHQARSGPGLSAAEEAQAYVDIVDTAVLMATVVEEEEEEEEVKSSPSKGAKASGHPRAGPPKKKKNNKKHTICRFFAGQGFCLKGSKCGFKHEKPGSAVNPKA